MSPDQQPVGLEETLVACVNALLDLGELLGERFR
jgi:hypothetical protein